MLGARSSYTWIVSIVNTLLIRGELERGEAGAIFIQSLLSCR
jgi:hypothetical protein